MAWVNTVFDFLLLMCYVSCGTRWEKLSRNRRTWIIESFAIEEEHPGPFPYVLGKINVESEYLIYFDLYGEGVDEEPRGVLSVDKESGTISVHKPVDYEKQTTLRLSFEARKEDQSLDTKLGIQISILDINDHPPRFPSELYEVSVNEDSVQGSRLLTVVAYDRDRRGTPNSTFHYEIKSVSPEVPDAEFYIDDSGTISFRGCLDHEVSDKITVVVEAKDHGDIIRLSSSTTVIVHVQDGNDHPPYIKGQTGSRRVKENQSGVSPLRLHVTDDDSRHSKAWNAKYAIQGDDGGHFKIETEPDGNDGILSVVKPLDFEEAAQRELLISVENEAPFFYCEVKARTRSGLWIVGTSDGAARSHAVKVTIKVEDVNDPPAFSRAASEATLEENAPIGTWVEKVNAVDPDSSPAQNFVYKVGHDPAGWLMVDPSTGDITTVKTPDRESPHVVNGVYRVLVHAVDNGRPTQTGTATVNIHISDQNDNVPKPTTDLVDVCVFDGPTTTNISAFDPDGSPFGGPFTFELLDQTSALWRLNPSYGFSAGLVKLPAVFSGPHRIMLKIADMQGRFGVYNLSVIVCDCSVTPHCRGRHLNAAKSVTGAVAVALASLSLLLFLLLMAVTMSCEKEFTSLQPSGSSGETLLPSNIETPGTDCEVPDPKQFLPVFQPYPRYPTANQISLIVDYLTNQQKTHRREAIQSIDWEQLEGFAAQFQDWRTTNALHATGSCSTLELFLFDLLQWRLSSLHKTEENEAEDLPRIYTDEGDSDEELLEVEMMPPHEDSFLDSLKDLDPKFRALASICRSEHTDM
ncbi:cadherin-like protein 26 [Neosynchiropus ocellatus]